MSEGKNYTKASASGRFQVRELCQDDCGNDARYTVVGLGVPPPPTRRTCGVHAEVYGGAAISDDKLPEFVRCVAILIDMLDRNEITRGADMRALIRGIIGLKAVAPCPAMTCSITLTCSYLTACRRPGGHP